MSELDEKTRVTTIVQKPAGESTDGKPPSNDCLVVIYTKEPTLLGKRFVLDFSPVRVGRPPQAKIHADLTIRHTEMVSICRQTTCKADRERWEG